MSTEIPTNIIFIYRMIANTYTRNRPAKIVFRFGNTRGKMLSKFHCKIFSQNETNIVDNLNYSFFLCGNEK